MNEGYIPRPMRFPNYPDDGPWWNTGPYWLLLRHLAGLVQHLQVVADRAGTGRTRWPGRTRWIQADYGQVTTVDVAM